MLIITDSRYDMALYIWRKNQQGTREEKNTEDDVTVIARGSKCAALQPSQAKVRGRRYLAEKLKVPCSL